MDFLSKKIKMPFLQYLRKPLLPFVWGYLRIGLGKSKRAKNFYVLSISRFLSHSKIFLPFSLTFAKIISKIMQPIPPMRRRPLPKGKKNKI